MPIRQEIRICAKTSVKPSNRIFSLRLPLRALIFLGVIALGVTIAARAQEKPSPQTPADTPSAGQSSNDKSRVPGGAVYNFLDHKSLFFPDIAVSTKRLSAREKFELFVDNSISLHTITWAALTSAVSQADNSPTGFGQGWDAYAERFGSSMGREASSEFFGTFVLASALHQDPRFYPDANPTFGHAVKHSVQRIFITRNDDGRNVANISGLAGPLMAEGLANVYWPERNRTVGDTFFRYGLDLATKAGGNMLREYWPVFYGKMHHSSRTSSGH
jgi:hypothetical protein